MKILMIGISVRALAESAVRSGYPVIALDAFGDVDLNTFCEGHSLCRDFQTPYSARGLFRASRQLKFDGVSYTANLENYPAVIADFARSARILGNPAGVLKRVRHWPTLFTTLQQAGFRTPLTVYSEDTIPADFEGQWLKKPLRGGSGGRISFFRPGQKLKSGFMLQEYIEGPSCSASFIANGRDSVVIGMTEQLIGVPGLNDRRFLYCGNLLPLERSLHPSSGSSILEQVQQIAALLTREFALTGFNGFDFMLAGGQVCLTEVNPRYGASMEVIERAYKLPVYDLHYRAVTDGELPAFDLQSAGLLPGHFYAKTILYADQDGTAPDTGSWLSRGVRDIPHSGEKLVKGQPICTLFAEGDSRDMCLINLARLKEAFKEEIYGA